MKIISALLGLSVCFVSLFIPTVSANDGPYEVLVVGYNYDTFMTNLGGRAGYEYLQYLSQNSVATTPSGSGGGSVQPPTLAQPTTKSQCKADSATLTGKLLRDAALDLQKANLTCIAYEASADAASVVATRGGYQGAMAAAAAFALNNQARNCREVNSANNSIRVAAINTTMAKWDLTVCEKL